VKYFREAELMHGRVAMLATVGFLTQEFFHPLTSSTNTLAIYQSFADVPLEYAALLLGVVSVCEIARVRRGFLIPGSLGASSSSQVRTFKSGYEPGDLGFDPLSLKPAEVKAQMSMKEKELNNGRLSMIGVAGLVAQEMATGQAVFATA